MAIHKISLPLCSLLILGACGYTTESSNQDIMFTTPNAQDARCHVYVDKLKYQVLPPQAINIKKSPNDMKITCDAPGNRHAKTQVSANLSKRAVWGGPAGVAWDYASQSLFYYPSVIAIDFSQEELRPNKLPQYNNSDIKQPEEYNLEEFRPSEPKLNSDRNKVEPIILRRGEGYPTEYIGDDMDTSVKGGKGDLESVIQGLTNSQEPAISSPLPIYPGE